MITTLCALACWLPELDVDFPAPMVPLKEGSTFFGAQPAVADLDGDGRLDVAVGSTQSVAVALQGSDGVLGAFADVPGLTQDVFALAVGDVDGNGTADLVATVESASEVRVALGHGDGTFAAPVATRVGAAPQGLALGHLDADGLLDAVTINELSDDTTVLLGHGDGTFTASAGPSAAGALAVVLDDVAGNTEVDLIVARTAGVSVHPGLGDGSFTRGSSVLAGNVVRGVVVDDFDGDAVPDLAAANDSINSISVLLGGAGGFEDPLHLPVGLDPWDVRSGDWNEDGSVDLTAGNLLSHTISFVAGQGDGTFAPAGSIPARSPSGLTPSDFDGDGHADLVVATNFPPSTILLLRGGGDGSFDVPSTFPTGQSPLATALGDIDADGHVDAVVTGRFPSSGSVALGMGDGTFGAPITFPVGFSPTDVEVAHLDRDPYADVVVLETFDEEIELFFGRSDGTLVGGDVIALDDEASALTVGDLDQDGSADIAVATREPTFPNGSAGRVALLFGLGDGTFTPAVSHTVGFPPQDVAIEDLDGNGVPDLVLSTNDGVATGFLAVALGSGAGTFVFPPLLSPAGPAPTELVTGDFDLDGDTDVAVSNRDDTIFPSTTEITIMLGQGDGTFVNCGCDAGFGLGSISANPPAVATADLTADGVLDLVAPLQATRRALTLFEGVGDGSFAAPRYYLGANQPMDVAVGDLDEDGLADVVVVDEALDRIWVHAASASIAGPTIYCTATASSAGCVAAIGVPPGGAPPVSGAGDFAVSATDVQELKNGLLLASPNGRAVIPFGSGVLCMNPPLKRGPIMSSGGAQPSGCGGAFATIVNTGSVIPSGLDAGPGNTAQYQYYYRDPANGAGQAGSALSNAVELCFSVGD